LVSGRRWHFDSESTNENSAVTKGMVTSAWEAGGAVRERMTCFSRSETGRGPFEGRSLGWSVTYWLQEVSVFDDKENTMLTESERK